MSHKPFNAIMVSETHWDRAWYVPYAMFLVRLVRLIDRVIEILDSDPSFKSFMLDGQTLPIEDYLEIRPERRGDLERLVRAGRLVIGPWYALADEYLVSPEALIRNLIIGLRMARELGGAMLEGYVPDAFGHINQLPQILQGFGIGSAVFWRGVGDEGERLGNEFWWEAPDTTRVLAIHLPDGYHNAANLGYPMRWGDTSAMNFDMELALDQLKAAVKLLKPRARTANLLLMNGTDHAEADPNVPAVIVAANAALPDVQIEHGTLSEFVARVRSQAAEAATTKPLPTFQGEFNRGRYAFMLQGVYSSRMHIKQANEQVQTLLERYAEPLAAWAWTLSAPHPTAFLEHAWCKLLQNHPHDDICGCSVDAVHRENMTRYAHAEQVAGTIARDSFRAVASHIDRTAQPGVPFVLFNPLAWSRSGTVEVNLLFDRNDPHASDFHLADPTGQPVPFQVLAQGEHFDMEVLKANRKREVRVAMAVDALPSCGYRVYYALPGTPPTSGGDRGRANGMENRYLRVEINPDGSLNVLDKVTGRLYRNVGYFEDTEDAGDLYDYSPARSSQTITSLDGKARVRMLHSGPLQASYEISQNLRLPVALTADRSRRRKETVACPITCTVTLRAEGRAVEFRAAVDNRARDHRLRICFPTNLVADHATAGGHFDVITRPIPTVDFSVDQPPGQGWVQRPVQTNHQRGLVDVSEQREAPDDSELPGTAGPGLAVFSRGLPEYEILRDGHNGEVHRTCTIAVTLLRCVDVISRGDLLSRSGHAGPPCAAPEGQCQGRYTFEYALRPHAGDWRAVYREAAEFQAPVYMRRGNETEGYLPNEVWPENAPEALTGAVKRRNSDLAGELPGDLSFLTLTPEALVLSAVKRSERGDALIVRFYNPTVEATRASLRAYRPIRSAQMANLNEEPQANLPLADPNTVELPVGPKQVCTVRLRL